MTDTSLERRIRRLEDRVEIGELIARYGLAMDGRDLDEIEAIFTPDAVLRSRDGVMNARGREAIVLLYRGRFTVLGPSNHFTHDRIVTFDANDPDLARGLVVSHAEMNRNGRGMIAAIRYADVYQRHEGAWRFAERELSFMYYVAAAEYVDALGPGLAKRMRAYDEPRAADWPEGLDTWRRFHGG
ncbi:MAG: nuclear transport factor 2 family protein [Steroidobacteraceae bacterium]|jgi:ketosteroid isomerase-like protein|nr:nuclear transport factor 2 family protein [Steroidobacteraceae bacterium]